MCAMVGANYWSCWETWKVISSYGNVIVLARPIDAMYMSWCLSFISNNYYRLSYVKWNVPSWIWSLEITFKTQLQRWLPLCWHPIFHFFFCAAIDNFYFLIRNISKSGNPRGGKRWYGQHVTKIASFGLLTRCPGSYRKRSSHMWCLDV